MTTTPPTLFDRVNEHIFPDYADDIAIKHICIEVDKEIEQLRARVAEHIAMLRWCYESQMKQLVKPTMDFEQWLGKIYIEIVKAAPQQEQE